MKNHTRRSIAYIATLLISKNIKNSIYDFSTSSYYNFSGSVEDGNINIFDFEQNCHISGSLPSIFHFGNDKHISINIDGDRFTGFDFSESQHFSGSVNGNSIQFYDFGESKYFNYSI